MPSLIGLGAGFFVLAAIFLVVEKLSPGWRGQAFFRHGFVLDVPYRFFTPLASGFVA